jgi:hypothetical protein
MTKQREAQILVFVSLSVVVLALGYYASEVGLIHLDDYMLTVIEIVTGSLLLALAIGMGYGLYRDKCDPAAAQHARIMNLQYHWREIPVSIWVQAVTKRDSDGASYLAWREGWDMGRVIREYEIRKEIK